MPSLLDLELERFKNEREDVHYFPGKKPWMHDPGDGDWAICLTRVPNNDAQGIRIWVSLRKATYYLNKRAADGSWLFSAMDGWHPMSIPAAPKDKLRTHRRRERAHA